MKPYSLIATLIGALATLVAAHAALAQKAPAAAAPTAPPAVSRVLKDDSYVLGPDDVIEVSVLGRADFTTRGRIGADGSMQLPYLGTVNVAKQTGRKLGEDLARQLEAGGYFSKPIVKVEIVSYASRYVIVLGSVGLPGLIPIDRPYRLSEIIARAGGVREGAADYVVLRQSGAPEKDIPIRTLATGDESADPYVDAGDKIYVPNAEVFYISGQVKSPGAYAIIAGMTLRMAIARGGGLTDAGSEKRVRVSRHGTRLAGANLDTKIEPGDVIDADEGLF